MEDRTNFLRKNKSGSTMKEYSQTSCCWVREQRRTKVLKNFNTFTTKLSPTNAPFYPLNQFFWLRDAKWVSMC